MSKDGIGDQKHRRAVAAVVKMRRVLQRPGPQKLVDKELWSGMHYLQHLKLTVRLVRKLKLRVLVRRALTVGSEAVQDLGHALLEEWQAAEDPAHELNKSNRHPLSDIYIRVSTRTSTRPVPVPTNTFTGRILDLKPTAQKIRRLYSYGWVSRDDGMDWVFDDMTVQQVPKTGMTPSECSEDSDDGLVPDIYRLSRRWNQITCDSSILYTSTSTLYSDSDMHTTADDTIRDSFEAGVTEALEKHSYPVVSTPRPPQNSW